MAAPQGLPKPPTPDAPTASAPGAQAGPAGNGGNGGTGDFEVQPAYQYQKDATLSQIFGGKHVVPGRELLDAIMKTYKARMKRFILYSDVGTTTNVDAMHHSTKKGTNFYNTTRSDTLTWFVL